MTHVYVIQAEGGPVKIGVAVDPVKRLAALRTGTPFRLSLAHVEPIEADLRAIAVERAAHAILKAARAHGEWFAVSSNEAREAVHEAMALLREGKRPQDTSADPHRAEAAQIRAARALLDITQAELALRAGISKTGLNNIERGTADPKASTLKAIQQVLEVAGVAFTNGGEPGVKLTRKTE